MSPKDERLGWITWLGLVVWVFIMGFLIWKAERWLNWKLDYSSKLEARLESIEKRLGVLEGENAESCP